MASRKRRRAPKPISEVNAPREGSETEGPNGFHHQAVLLRELTQRFWWVVLIGVSLLVQFSYLHIGHVWDDIRHLGLIGEIALGRLSWMEFFLRFHNEHFIGLWKVWYLLTWQLSGTNPIGWHIGITLGHSFSAIFLYLTLRHFALDSPIPAVASFAWAGAAIGRWDNPLLWIAASHLSFAIMWLMAATWCMTKCREERGWYWWAIAMAASVTAAICTMGVTALMTVSLMVQFVWLHQGMKLPAPKRGVWFLAWFVPFACGTIWQVYVLSRAHLPTTAGQETVTIGGMLQGTMTLFSVALGHLFSGLIWDTQAWGVALPVLVGAAAWAVVAYDSRLRNVTILLFLTCAAYTVVVARARANMPPDVLASFGRFLYVPTLSWCVVIAVAATSLVQRVVLKPSLRFPLSMALACGYLIQQSGLAAHSSQMFVELNHEVVNVLPDNVRLVEQLQSSLGNDTNSVEISDFPVFVRPLYQPFSVLRAYARQENHGGDFRVVLRPIQELESLRNVLQTIDNPEALRWLALLETLEAHHFVLGHFNNDAAQFNKKVTIQPVEIDLG